MKSRFRTIALAVAGVALALTAVTVVDAQRGPGRPGGPGPGGRGPGGFGPPMGLAIERMDRELSFTDAQRSQIESLLSAERSTFQGTMSEMRTAQQAVENAIMQTPADEGLIEANVNAVSALQARLGVAHAKTEAKIFALLTADQQQKVRQFLADRSARRQRKQ
jgi:periplasmic protein CpxP/Spy